jgi:Peptidase family M28
MLSVSPSATATLPMGIEQTLHEVVETLAPIERTPCSPGERAAAEWLAARLRAVSGVEVELEDEPSWGTFPPTATGLGLTGVLAAAVSLCGHRALGRLLAAATLAGIVDEANNGPRLVRRLVRRRRTTVNLVARTGDANAPATIVVLAHHDAPQTGIVFDQTLQRKIYERAPHVIERLKTPLPQWWFGLAGPLATLIGSRRPGARGSGSGTRGAGARRSDLGARRCGLGRSSGLGARIGLVLGLVGTALVADMWRSETVPGANDNLSGAACLVALAELLREHPIPAQRVLLVSCGAEETLQDGIRAFIRRHRHELDPASTRFINLDAVGSPHLVLLEGEGPIRMEEYRGPWLRDLFAERAASLAIPLHRGYRARASTDSVIPSRAGYPIATLVSMTDWRAPANYHLPSDIPANLDYATVADAARLVYDVALVLAAGSGD